MVIDNLELFLYLRTFYEYPSHDLYLVLRRTCELMHNSNCRFLDWMGLDDVDKILTWTKAHLIIYKLR